MSATPGLFLSMHWTIVTAGLAAASCALAAQIADDVASSAGWTNVYLYEHKDFGGDVIVGRMIGASEYSCVQVSTWLHGKISSYKVENGDCDFFASDNCQDFMFRAANRSDKRLRTKDNDRMRSYRCKSTL